MNALPEALLAIHDAKERLREARRLMRESPGDSILTHVDNWDRSLDRMVMQINHQLKIRERRSEPDT